MENPPKKRVRTTGKVRFSLCQKVSTIKLYSDFRERCTKEKERIVRQ